MSNDIDKSVNRLNAAENIRRQAIALQKHISETLSDLQTNGTRKTTSAACSCTRSPSKAANKKRGPSRPARNLQKPITILAGKREP